MNSSLNNKRRRRYYTQETALDKTVAFLSMIFSGSLAFLESVCEFLGRPGITLIIKGVCIFGVLAIIIGAVGGLEAGTLLFSAAMIRIFGSLAASCVIFKAIGD